METLIITILSVLAFIGLTYLAQSYLSRQSPRVSDPGCKLILYIPQGSEAKLEGLVRRIFLEQIPKKLMTDGVVYIMLPEDQQEGLKIAETLKKNYPLVVLPDLNHVLYDYKGK